jgi:hypothetical protein
MTKLFKIFKWFVLAFGVGLLLGTTLELGAQTISITATITDSDSQIWNNGAWSVRLQSPGGQPYYNGTAISTAPQIGVMNSSGALAVTLYNTSTITPISALYVFTLCAQTSAPCSTITIPVTTSNLSSVLSAAVTAPRFSASPVAFGYLDVEVNSSINPGAQYFNVTNSVNRIWTGTAWQNSSGGSAYNPTSVTITGGTINTKNVTFFDPTSSIQTQLNTKQASGTYVTPTTLNNGTLPVTATTLAAALATPASSSATGVVGTVAWDSGFIYVCVATNTWVRVATATW